MNPVSIAIVVTIGIGLWILSETKAYAGTSEGSGMDFPFSGYFIIESGKTGVSVRLMRAIVSHESGFNPQAVNTETAADKRLGRDVDSLGLCQILWPDTANALGVTNRSDLFDPAINLRLGFLVMKGNLKRYPVVDEDGFPAAAVAAYNAGSARYNPDGTYRNQAYINAVKEQWEGFA